MRLLFLNRSFWPDPEATGQFLTELCEDLSAEHRITFIAGPSLHVKQGSRRLFTRDRYGEVEVIRTWGTRFSKRRLAGRLANLALYYVLAAAAALRVERPDVIIAETDPPLLGALAAMLKRRWGCKFVYNVRDLYPDIAEVNGGLRSRALIALLRRANIYAFREADLIVPLGLDMAKRIAAKDVPASKITVIPDWADTNKVFPISNSRFRAELGERFVVMYSGNLGLSQQLDTVVDAAMRLRADPRILFVLIGEGASKPALQARVRKLELDNVMFLPYRSREQLAESLSAADLHLIPLLSGAQGCVVPSKIYGILAAGRPFIAIMESGAEIARIAREYTVGFVVPPGDADALTGTIMNAASRRADLHAMGLRARELAVRLYTREVATRRFAAMLQSLSP
ncbi:MAG: glycosyltransferase family 4 protein [Candidatus Binataceae bacterium]